MKQNNIYNSFRFNYVAGDSLQLYNEKYSKLVLYFALFSIKLLIFLKVDIIFSFLIRNLKNKISCQKKVAVVVFTQNHYKTFINIFYNKNYFRLFNLINNLKIDIVLLALFIEDLQNVLMQYNQLKYTDENLYLYVNCNPRKYFELFAYNRYYIVFLSKFNTIVHFNDHSPKNVLLFDFCKLYNIKSVYIQHAPVTAVFPKLYNDFNALYSEDSVDKYFPIKKDFVTFFDPRFPDIDTFVHSCPPNNSVLICLNELDNLEIVYLLISKLIDLSFIVTVRMHPLDKRVVNVDNFKLSKSLSIWDDLCSNSIVICNNTAVVLEAIYLMKSLYICEFLSLTNERDSYGFQSSNLILKTYFSVEELIVDLNILFITYDRNKLHKYLGDIENKGSLLDKLHNRIICLK